MVFIASSVVYCETNCPDFSKYQNKVDFLSVNIQTIIVHTITSLKSNNMSTYIRTCKDYFMSYRPPPV